jgi:hypothetical protein
MNNKASSVVMPLPSAGQIYGMERPEGNRGVGYVGAAMGREIYILCFDCAAKIRN